MLRPIRSLTSSRSFLEPGRPIFTTPTRYLSSSTNTMAAQATIKSTLPHSLQNRNTPTSGDYDTALSSSARQHLRTYGLTPPSVQDFATQSKRCLDILHAKPTAIDKFMYLTYLRASNVHLFYRLLAENIKELTPLIYTPTVGEACLRWHEIYTVPEGMYLSYSDKGNLRQIIENWPHEVEITVLTDGSRILGLGDLGINGMGIPVGKLALYVSCAGISPEGTLPLTVDLGTSNKALREDPLYMGSRRDKVTAGEEKEFLDELMAALKEKWPAIVIQFEDWKNPFPALERYQNVYTCFNDDIQGTGAVILGGFINAVKMTGIAPKNQRAVFFGAGSAGVGVAKQMVQFFMAEGLSEDEARKRFWLVDSKGLITNDRGDKLAPHKTYFSRDDNNGEQVRSLHDVIEYVKPTILMGLSTIGGAFDKKILKRMAELNDKPVIFPLSNPSSQSECNFEDAVKYTDGRVLFASGSPFNPLTYKNKTLTPGQGNNIYVFPGIGLAAILSKAISITQSMIYASAESLAASINETERNNDWLYPDITRIREVSVTVTRGVIRAAQEAGVDRAPELRNLNDEELDEYIRQRMYDPRREITLMEEHIKKMSKQ